MTDVIRGRRTRREGSRIVLPESKDMDVRDGVERKETELPGGCECGVANPSTMRFMLAGDCVVDGAYVQEDILHDKRR